MNVGKSMRKSFGLALVRPWFGLVSLSGGICECWQIHAKVLGVTLGLALVWLGFAWVLPQLGLVWSWFRRGFVWLRLSFAWASPWFHLGFAWLRLGFTLVSPWLRFGIVWFAHGLALVSPWFRLGMAPVKIQERLKGIRTY